MPTNERLCIPTAYASPGPKEITIHISIAFGYRIFLRMRAIRLLKLLTVSPPRSLVYVPQVSAAQSFD